MSWDIPYYVMMAVSSPSVVSTEHRTALVYSIILSGVNPRKAWRSVRNKSSLLPLPQSS